MFIRKTLKIDRRSKKEYHQYQLVESVRTDRGPRQHLLLNLGVDLDILDNDRKQLANCIEEKVRGHAPLIPYPPHIESLAERFARQLINREVPEKIKVPSSMKSPKSNFVSIDIESISHTFSRTIGIEHVCLETIRKLQLDAELIRLGFTKRQVEVTIGVIIGRLAGCVSEKATFEWLKNISGLGELLDTGFESLAMESVYRAADRLLEKKHLLESFLYQKEKTLFTLDDSIIFYDLTNTYFEGQANSISKASKGRSKDKRADCPLVTLGIRMDRNGFILQSEIFPGNISEATTLQDAITQLGGNGTFRRTIVLDAGIATESNVTWLRENDYSYIVCSRRREQNPPSDITLEVVREKNGNVVRAGSYKNLKTGETELYCHSKFKESTEIKWRKMTRKRFEAGLTKLNEGLHKKNRTKGLAAVERKIGALKKQYSRIGQYYKINVQTNPKDNVVTEINWTFDEEKSTSRLAGNYCLRSYGLGEDTQQLWDTYIMLTQVEEGFRCLKSELGLRPIYHQKEERLDGHLFLTILAYHVLQSIQFQLRKKDINFRWETIQRRLYSHIRVTTSMLTKENKTLHVRSSTSCEPFHKQIYSGLGLSHTVGSKIKKIL